MSLEDVRAFINAASSFFSPKKLYLICKAISIIHAICDMNDAVTQYADVTDLLTCASTLAK